ncbi:hypothetical protein F5Y19DRAFT_469257 [Xylariaceae sp. FL1651]|nr:hypothetical protein F5Y19DRAFT_469257 [Xylariaceae sp. FL1651]
MSALSRDRDQGGPSPHISGGPSGSNTIQDDENPIVGNAARQLADPDTSSSSSSSRHEAAGQQNAEANMVNPAYDLQMPGICPQNASASHGHQNTMTIASRSSNPSTSSKHPNGNSQAKGTVNVGGIVNEMTNLDSGSRSSHPPAPLRSHSSSSLESREPIDPENPTTHDGDSDNRNGPPVASLFPDHSLYLSANSSSLAGIEEQGGANEQRERGIRGSRRLDQNIIAPAEDDGALTEFERDSSSNPQTSHSVPSVGNASDRHDELISVASYTSRGPVRHVDGGGDDSGLTLREALDEQDILGHEPSNTDGSSQSRNVNPTSRAPTLSRPESVTPELSRPSSSGLNPIAPSFIPRSQQRSTPQEIMLPRWQPDSEVTNCPICNVRFGIFIRKHHCRKCGRVVCDRCSPHRITIPHPYIVRPPGDQGYQRSSSLSIEGGIADFSSIGGGERVRLCNPCVPDPNTTPPRAQQSTRPIVVDGRTSHHRSQSNSVGNLMAGTRPLQRQQLPSLWDSNPSRTRSASMNTGPALSHYSSFSGLPQATRNYYQPSDSPYLPRHLVSPPGPYFPPYAGPSARFPASLHSSGLNRPLPATPDIPEEDECPVCHNELPSRDLPNCEALRETHINNCIASHSSYGAGQSSAATRLGSHGTPPPLTTRRTRMFPYSATEKDCVDDAECTICLEEFKVGDSMARLECLCRFHRLCIDSWFVGHPGRCPVHQHDSYGY